MLKKHGFLPSLNIDSWGLPKHGHFKKLLLLMWVGGTNKF